MKKKSLYGIWGIVIAALALILLASLYGKNVKLNYIEQIHLQDGYLYYVDRGESENLKIIRSDPNGKQGKMIMFQRHENEQYRIICQIFFDDEGGVYALIQEMNVKSWNGVSNKVYKCDFTHGRLEDTEYDLTADTDTYSQISVQCIQDGKLCYICIPDTEKKQESAKLFTLNQQGEREQKDEILLEYPYLNAQFFLNEDGILLWTDYESEIHAKRVGTEDYLEIQGITGKKGMFKTLADDGKYAYVLDYSSDCVIQIDPAGQTSQVLFSGEKIREDYPEFTFRELHSLDCTASGFCAGTEEVQGMRSICSYQNGNHEDIGKVSLTAHSVINRMFWVYAGILLAAFLFGGYWLACVKYHVQTVLVRLCLIFLLGLLVMDSFLEWWIEQSMREQLENTQTLSLSALGKVLKEDIVKNIETNLEMFPSGDRALMLSHRTISNGRSASELSLYVYSILHADEEGQLYVRESMSEYSGVPVEWAYTSEVSESIYQAYDTGEVVNKMDENQSGRQNNQFIPVILNDGTKYGVLVVSGNGNMMDYQIWYYQWNMKNASSMLLLVLTVILMVILYIFLRPLKTLKECAGKLASGELGVTMEVHGHDEMADIASTFNQMSLELENYVEDIRSMSDGYYKFIPAKILELLGKESIQDVRLGDQMKGELTILSLHAIDYPKQSALLSAEQVYTDINRVLSMLVEPINIHRGVVEHFEDTGLSAFFTVSSREALDAAIEIQRLLERQTPGNGRTIAISYGQVMLGVIGHEKRMEATAISAHSDLAKALRLKGDKYGAHILITHLVYRQIPDFEEHYHARYLGNIYLAADHTYERIYDVYDGDSEEEFYYKELTRPLFEQGVGLFVEKKFYEARLVFVEVLKQHRKDKAAKEYLYRCDRYYKLPPEEEVETIIEKF